jgi:hypothetical protein
MGYHIGYQRVENGITMHFRKWNSHAWRHFVFHNALHHLMLCDSISTPAQYVSLDNKIKCLSFFCFGIHADNWNPYIWELLIANQLDQTIWSTNQKYWAAVMSNLLYSFLEVHNSVCTYMLFPRKCYVQDRASCTNLLQENPFPELNWHILTFSKYISLSGGTYGAVVEIL